MLNDLYVSARSLVRTPLNLLLNQVDPPVLVLIYHRVTTLPTDPEMLAVTPENFRQQMRYLKENVPFVRFEDDWEKAAKPAVCITFDDGYADNALEALPILEEVGVPATFFISTGTIGTVQEFWWDKLERIVLGGRGVPPCFTLNDLRCGNTWPTATATERRIFYLEFVRLMTDVDTERRNDWISQLHRWAKGSFVTTDTHRAMAVDELRLLGASGWVTIGAHTVTHSRLSSLSTDRQREEIEASKKQLEEWLGREITVFSYPYGKRRDYTKESVALCREAGFIKAAVNFSGLAHRWTDPYQVPRRLVRNWPVEVFAEKLRGFWTR